MEQSENRIPSGGSYLMLNETNNATNIQKQIMYNPISINHSWKETEDEKESEPLVPTHRPRPRASSK
jgi:hypothetical protein